MAPLYRMTRRGFTLLELIVSLAMVAMLSLSLYMSLRVGFRARDSAYNAVGAMRSANVAIELIRQDIESAMRPTGIMAGEFLGEAVVDGQNAADTVTFFTLGSDFDDSQDTHIGGIEKIELGLGMMDGSQPRALVRRVTSNLLSPYTMDPREEILCRNVKNFTLRYFDGFDWQEVWDSTAVGDVLPMAVEVMLELDWPARSGGEPTTYRVNRIFMPACRTDLTTTGVTP